MDNAQLWEHYQDWLYYNAELGFYLDVSRMSFDDAFVNKMKPKFDKAFKDLEGAFSPELSHPCSE